MRRFMCIAIMASTAGRRLPPSPASLRAIPTARGALKILEQAGTGEEYRGLWRDVAAFRPLPSQAKLPALEEAADVESLTAAMAEIDRAFRRVKTVSPRRLGRSGRTSRPGSRGASHAAAGAVSRKHRLLAGNEKRDARFRQRLGEAEAVARKLETALQAGEKLQAEQSFQRLDQRCNECHATYRN